MQSSCSNESLIKPDTLLMWAYAAHPRGIFFHESLVHHWGNRRGISPFCWKSKNQEVFGVSLVVKRSLTFSFTESIPGVQGRGATLQKMQA